MTEFLRRPRHYYQDPLTHIWIDCAERVGFCIERSPEVYASSDGKGAIFIGSDETLDVDDSLAQMIFHELCHALVQGEAGEAQVDWGLDNTRSGGNPWREHACLRLQAYLAGSVGLRDFFAPTTDYRLSFWDSLPADPFAAPAGRREASCVAARLAAWRASQARWALPLRQALAASAAIAAVTSQRIPAKKILPSLWETAAAMPPLHSAGHACVAPYYNQHACANCAWVFVLRGVKRCRHAPQARLANDAPACVRWEPAAELDCLGCGACCREAYHAVEFSRREPLNKRHPALVVIDGNRRKLLRDGERCAALQGGETATAAYACSIYAERPRICREFTRGSDHCLDARRRVGLSL